jgi:hypothetical protein
MSKEGIVNGSDSSRSNSSTENIITVSINTLDANIQFKGSLESVYKNTIDFIVKQFPNIDIVKKISLNYSVDYLVKKYSNLIKVIPDKGTQVLVQLDRSEEDAATYKVEQLEKPKNEEEPQKPKSSADHSSDSMLLERKKKWPLKELIALHLVASRITNSLGITQDEGLQIYEIEYATQAHSNSVNSRLSEMTKSGYVIKDLKFDNTAGVGEEKPSTIYTITTTGIHWLNHIIDSKEKRIDLSINRSNEL